VSQAQVSAALVPAATPLHIGADTATYHPLSTEQQWFQGMIDEVRIYDGALTAAQILADMNTALVPPDTQPPAVTLTAPASGATGTLGDPLTGNTAGSGTGTVTSTPAGITCGTDCSESYASGTAVTLAATPAVGSVFSGWSGGGCTGTGACTLTLTAATTVTATFTPTFTLTVTKAGSGTVTSTPARTGCGRGPSG